MKSRLNHFILWCKGWYQSLDNNEDIFESAAKALKLDGYDLIQKQYVIPIVLNYIDELVDKDSEISNLNYLRMYNWNNEISRMMTLYNSDYNVALMYVIKNFFQFEITRKHLSLEPPIYSRKIFNMGFMGPKHLGNSYKMLNHKTKQFFKDHRI